MASENELNEYFNHAVNVIATAYHHATRDGSVAALGREAIKDVRNTINEVFFGKGERGGEPGAPLNPLFHDIVEDRKSHETALGGGLAAGKPMTAGQIASEPEEHRGGVHGQQQEQATGQGSIGQGGEQGRGAPAPAKAGVDGPEKGVPGPEKGGDGRDNAAPGQIATAGQIAEDKGLEGQQNQGNVHGQEFAQQEKTFVERLAEERKGNQGGNAGGDQSFVERIRTLPGEQREQEKGQGR
jgi:hypothetical protein